MRGNNATILIVFGLLSSCQNPTKASEVEPTPDLRICQPVPTQGKGQWGACIHRNAYKYARASDPAEIVAKAVSSSCGEPVAELVNATSLENRMKLLNETMAAMDAFALQKVIEARAGKCDVPE